MSIRDALRVIAAEKRIEELGGAFDELAEELDELTKQVADLAARLEALRPAQTPQPRPQERR
jgi:prefoldin subunit 5